MSYINKLKTTNTSHADYWSLLNQFWEPNKHCNYLITLNGNPVHDEYVKCNLFNEYFASISNSPAYGINKLPPFHFLTDHRLLPPTLIHFMYFAFQLVYTLINPKALTIYPIESQNFAANRSLLLSVFF